MFQPNQYPSPDIIKTWALLLNATERDVSAWVDAHKAEDSGTEHSFHLPTPSESTSPEPSKTSFPAIIQQQPTFKPEPSQSPVISSFSIASTLGRREEPSSMRHPASMHLLDGPACNDLCLGPQSGVRTSLVYRTYCTCDLRCIFRDSKYRFYCPPENCCRV